MSEEKISVIALVTTFCCALLIAKGVGYLLSAYKLQSVFELITAILFMTTFYAPVKFLLKKYL